MKQIYTTLWAVVLTCTLSSSITSLQAMEAGEIRYVSPAGKADAPGTREKPLLEIQKAVEVLNQSGGIIRLLEGEYQKTVQIPAAKGATKELIIEAEEGAHVVFNGSRNIDSTALRMDDGLIIVSASEVINLWDAKSKVRYLKQIDAEGVKAWPGSFYALEKDKLLIHPSSSSDAPDLKANRLSVGIEILRNKTTIKGIRFDNFLGIKPASAISVQGAKDVSILNCQIWNTVRGIQIDRSAQNVIVRNCQILDVATGIDFGGVGLEAEGNIIIAASGDFVIREEADFDEVNGIRFYHPAERGVIRNCLTAGFWAGLYQKTTAGSEGAQPFLCENTIFLDGIRTGTSPQTANTYKNNIVAGGETVRQRLSQLGAKLEANYFFTYGKTVRSTDSLGNIVGRIPFRDLASGRLHVADRNDIPDSIAEVIKGFANQQFVWPPEMLTRLAAEPEIQKVRLLHSPVCASSREGAVITAQFNMATDGVLKYRVEGETAWRQISGKPTQLKTASTNPESLDPAEDIILPDATDALIFDLLSVGLKPETKYEYLIEAGQGQISTAPEKFFTRGEGKILTVNPNDGPNGLQNALNLALPGDEIHLTPGVFAQSGVLAHSGKPGKPIRIKGSGPQVTILDGGKRHTTMLRLDHVRDVIVSDLQMRLFQRSGITAENCTNLLIEGCRFLNKEISHVGYTKGTGVVLTDSPGVTVSRSVFTRLLYGIQAVNSPSLTLENNTAFKNLYSAALVKNSSRDSRILRNSFTFTGNTSLYLIEADPKAFASLSCDYNNYGTSIRTIGETAQRSYATVNMDLPTQVEPPVSAPARYGKLSGSKRIIDFIPDGASLNDQKRQRFFSMSDWRSFSGKDQHSIFSDPGYVDPLAGDFRVGPDSPNVANQITGIGAFPHPAP